LHDASILALAACICPETEAEDDEFAEVLSRVSEDLKIVGSASTMLHGLQGRINSRDIPPEVNKVLMDFFTLRTGIKFLMQHYMEARKGKRYGFAGIFQLDCRPANIARKAALESSRVCGLALGQAPEIVVRGDVDETLTYVPVVLQYMLQEIFKNACRAVVEKHYAPGDDDTLPPVVCDVEAGADRMVLKIRDQGCGMSRQELDKMWGFMHSTYKHSPWARGESGSDIKASGSVLAGYGVGIPLSRMYAQYFGGDLQASSQEGQGTEVIISLSHSPLCQEVLPSTFFVDSRFADRSVDIADMPITSAFSQGAARSLNAT